MDQTESHRFVNNTVDGRTCTLTLEVVHFFLKLKHYYNEQGPDFEDMSSLFACEIDDAIQCIILGYGAQAPKIIII